MDKVLARKAGTADWLCDQWSDTTQVLKDSRILFGLLW